MTTKKKDDDDDELLKQQQQQRRQQQQQQRMIMKEAENRAKICQNTTEMPSLSHLSFHDYNNVYEPSDDTYLLLDALSLEFDKNDKNNNTSTTSSPIMTTLEIGCGTGVATIHLAKILRQRQRQQQTPLHYVTDINPHALSLTLRTATANNLPLHSIEAIRCDLASPFICRSSSSSLTMDVIIFNPPYVPTPDDEVMGCGIEASWAGGRRGRVVIDRVLPQIASLLKRKRDGASAAAAAAYMITVDDNDPWEIVSVMRRDYGVDVIPLVRRKARNEYLTVLKMTMKEREGGCSGG